MLRRFKELRGINVQGLDDRIGRLHDLFFDDQTWTVRYLVTETGGWLTGRRVLLPPTAVPRPNWNDRVLRVSLTKAQVEASPPIYEHRPVSRQMEIELHDYFDWNPYWTIEPITGNPSPGLWQQQRELAADAGVDVRDEPAEESGDPHLRSCQELLDYAISARDGALGHVEDFVINDDQWRIQCIIIDTRNWLPGKKVLIEPAHVREIVWPEALVHVDMTRQEIQDSPRVKSHEALEHKSWSQLMEPENRSS